MALIPAFHEVFGWNLVPESRVRLHPDEWSTYDPAAGDNVDQVVAYLRKAGPRERERVLNLERAGKNRKTVLEQFEDTETPDAVGAGTTNPAGDDPGTSTED